MSIKTFCSTLSKVWLQPEKRLVVKKHFFEKNFVKETRNLSRLRDIPNIVQTTKFSNDDFKDSFTLVLQYNGQDLLEFKKANDIDEVRAKNMFRQMVQILFTLEENGFKHRDVKTENFVIDTNNVITLIDVVTVTHQTDSFYNEREGTPFYMSPEALFQKYHGEKSDVWSLGVVFYTLLFDTYPHRSLQEVVLGGSDFSALLRKRLHSTISSDLKDLLVGMLRVEASARLSFKEVLEHSWFQDKKRSAAVMTIDTVDDHINKKVKT